MECQNDAPSDQNSDSQNDLQGRSSNNWDDRTTITADGGTSNDRNANSNCLTRRRSTANTAEKMISSMPPHVRAVADRGPDLVSKLSSEDKEPQSSMLHEYHRRTKVALLSVLEGEIPLESE